ncbi:hypothetical protein GV764_20305, partial [Atlantibacter hermannii]
LTAGTTPDGVQSTFAVSPSSVAADNTATSTLTFTARDTNGNIISGIAGNLSIKVTGSLGGTPSSSEVVVSSLTETGSTGVYT